MYALHEIKSPSCVSPQGRDHAGKHNQEERMEVTYDRLPLLNQTNTCGNTFLCVPVICYKAAVPRILQVSFVPWPPGAA